MEYVKDIIDEECDIIMKGRITFADHASFKKILESITKEPLKQVKVNIGNVDFVDSAALGMFLLLKDTVDKKNVALMIKNPVGQVKKMFEISRFFDLFNIVES